MILNIPTSYTNYIFNVKYVNVNMYVPNSNFELNFCTYVFWKSFWHYGDSKVIVGHRDIY